MSEYTEFLMKLQKLVVVDTPSDAAALDFAWFADNPGRLYRARWAIPTEVNALRVAGSLCLPGCKTAMAVRHLAASGWLVYEHGHISPDTPIENTTEAQAEAFYEYFLGRMKGAA